MAEITDFYKYLTASYFLIFRYEYFWKTGPGFSYSRLKSADWVFDLISSFVENSLTYEKTPWFSVRLLMVLFRRNGSSEPGSWWELYDSVSDEGTEAKFLICYRPGCSFSAGEFRFSSVAGAIFEVKVSTDPKYGVWSCRKLIDFEWELVSSYLLLARLRLLKFDKLCYKITLESFFAFEISETLGKSSAVHVKLFISLYRLFPSDLSCDFIFPQELVSDGNSLVIETLFDNFGLWDLLFWLYAPLGVLFFSWFLARMPFFFCWLSCFSCRTINFMRRFYFSSVGSNLWLCISLLIFSEYSVIVPKSKEAGDALNLFYELLDRWRRILICS